MLNERSYVFLNLTHIQAQFEKIHGKTENINLLENNSIMFFREGLTSSFLFFSKISETNSFKFLFRGISFMIYQKNINTFLLVK